MGSAVHSSSIDFLVATRKCPVVCVCHLPINPNLDANSLVQGPDNTAGLTPTRMCDQSGQARQLPEQEMVSFNTLPRRDESCNSMFLASRVLASRDCVGGPKNGGCEDQSECMQGVSDQCPRQISQQQEYPER
eukprot:3661734-Amphidinium_carterae.1